MHIDEHPRFLPTPSWEATAVIQREDHADWDQGGDGRASEN